MLHSPFIIVAVKHDIDMPVNYTVIFGFVQMNGSIEHLNTVIFPVIPSCEIINVSLQNLFCQKSLFSVFATELRGVVFVSQTDYTGKQQSVSRERLVGNRQHYK